MRRLLLILLFLEVGLALIIVPWSTFWERNYFAQVIPVLGPIMTNNFVRGAISGLGVVNVVAGLTELGAVVMARFDARGMANPSVRGRE